VKTFWSAQEIEDLAAQGKRELIIDENTVLTDLARHAAQQLGLKLVHRSQASTPIPATSPGSTAPSRRAVVGPGSKPKGCQHAPLTSQQAAAVTTVSSNSGTVVDQLVGLVKRLGPKGSGS
jgi:hypothetical protein